MLADESVYRRQGRPIAVTSLGKKSKPDCAADVGLYVLRLLIL